MRIEWSINSLIHSIQVCPDTNSASLRPFVADSLSWSMILNGRFPTSLAVNPYRKTCNTRSQSSTLSCDPPKFSCRSSWTPLAKLQSNSYLGSQNPHLAASSAPLLLGGQGSLLGTIPKLPKRQVLPSPPRASKDVPYSYRFPAMTKKPKWWWRTLACIPYLMPLHETWMYAETAYHLHPFLEDFEFITYPFLGAIGKLPSWSLMAYFFIAYLGIVRRKEWPHFFRFHVVMGMLLEIALQVVGTVSRWLPLGFYWGKIGMHFWTVAAFGYLFTVLECIRCSLAGMYADLPFFCDAAYIQIPYD